MVRCVRDVALVDLLADGAPRSLLGFIFGEIYRPRTVRRGRLGGRLGGRNAQLPAHGHGHARALRVVHARAARLVRLHHRLPAQWVLAHFFGVSSKSSNSAKISYKRAHQHIHCVSSGFLVALDSCAGWFYCAQRHSFWECHMSAGPHTRPSA